MIRYYESIGLISNVSRTDAGYWVYSDDEVHTLRFVRRARDLGFLVDQMTDLLALWSDRSRASADVKRIAMKHVAELERKMRELRDGRPHCPIIEQLSSGHEAGRSGGPNAALT